MNDDREELEARIAAFLDGQLPPAEAARLEVFLANTDRELADRVISMVHDKSALQALPKPAAPDDLSGRIMEAVERASLLHGVEHLAHPQRRWWHSRAAIAAGLVLVLGCFAYFIIQSFYRPDNAWQKIIAFGPGNPTVHRAAAVDARRSEDVKSLEAEHLASLRPAPSPGAIAIAGADKEKELAASSEAGAGPAIAASPASETLIEKQVVRAQQNANVSYDTALKNGYAPAASPQAALSAVNAEPHQFAGGPPVLLTLVARDAADPQRLRALLEHLMTQDAALSAEQYALFERINNGTTVTLNGGNAYLSKAADYNANTKNSPKSESPAGAGKLAGPASQIAAGGNSPSTDSTISNDDHDRSNTTNSTAAAGIAYNVYDARRRAFDQVANGTAALNAAELSSSTAPEGNGNFDAPNNAHAVKDTAKYAENQYAQQNNLKLSQNARSYSSAPFRLVLHPAQLNEIVDDFQVHSITRGANAYIINNDRYAGGNNREQDQISGVSPTELAKGLHDESPSAPVIRAAAPGAAASASEPAASAPPPGGLSPAVPSNTEMAMKSRVESPPSVGEKAPTRSANELKVAGQSADDVRSTSTFRQSTEKPENQWIECIITMKPAPGNGAQGQLDANIPRNAK